MSALWSKIRDGNILMIHHSTSSTLEIRVYEEDSDRYNEIYMDYYELESLKRAIRQTDNEQTSKESILKWVEENVGASWEKTNDFFRDSGGVNPHAYKLGFGDAYALLKELTGGVKV
jgi:hypothetical protein